MGQTESQLQTSCYSYHPLTVMTVGVSSKYKEINTYVTKLSHTHTHPVSKNSIIFKYLNKGTE